MEKEIASIIGKRIKQARNSKKISQTEVAAHLGYESQSYISEIESGKKQISANDLGRLAKLFEVTIEYLYGKTLEPCLVAVSAEELELLRAYREASQRDKEITKRLLQSVPFDQTSGG